MENEVEKEKAKLLSQALGACGIQSNNMSSFIILETIEVLKLKGDQFSLKDASKIQAQAKEAYAKPKEKK